MSWILIILQIIMALPKIIAIIKEIIDLIKQIRNKPVQENSKKHLFWLVGRLKSEGMHPALVTEIHSFRDELKAQVAAAI